VNINFKPTSILVWNDAA